MQILRFEARDFCGFENIHCRFTPGLNLLVGPNGSGKSSILEGLNILFYASSAARSPYIRVGANSTTLRAEFSLGDSVFLCKRHIAKNSSSAEIVDLNSGNVVCYGVGAVKSFFDSAFNLEGRGFSWYLKQGSIHSFLSVFANYDMDRIFSLFGIGALKNFNAYFSAVLKTIYGNAQADYSHADYLCTDLETKISDQVAQLEVLREQASGCAALKAECDQLGAALRRLDEQKKFVDIQRYRANLIRSAEEVDKNLASVDEELSSLKKKLKEESFPDAEEVTDELLATSLYEINQQLALHAKQKVNYAKYLELRKQIDQTLVSVRNRPRPAADELKQAVALHQDVKSRLSVYQKNDPRLQLENYHRQNLTGQCPMCGQDIHVEQLKKFADECALLESEAFRLQGAVRALQKQQATRAELRRSVRVLRQAYRAFRGLASYSASREEELLRVRDYISSALERFRFLSSERLRLQEKKDSIISSLAQIKEFPSVAYPGEEAHTLVKLRYSELAQRVEEAEKAVSQVQASEALLDWLKNSLTEAQSSRARYKKNSDIVTLCTNLGKSFVEDVQQFICNLLSEGGFLSVVNGILSEIDAVYRVSFEYNGENYDFIATFPDGTKISVMRLSYGQQVILALILLFVFYLMTCSTGVLLVDEPTAGLDARHLTGISTVLDRMNVLCRNQNVQCIMATHEADILRGEYNVIQIEKEAHT